MYLYSLFKIPPVARTGSYHLARRSPVVGVVISLPDHRFILLQKKVLRRCISIKKHQHKREEKVKKGFEVFESFLFPVSRY
jgi:hypothetical protein